MWSDDVGSSGCRGRRAGRRRAGGRQRPAVGPAGRQPVGTPARRAGHPHDSPGPVGLGARIEGAMRRQRSVGHRSGARRVPPPAAVRRGELANVVAGAGAAACVSGTGSAAPARSGGVPEGCDARGRHRGAAPQGDAPAAPARASRPGQPRRAILIPAAGTPGGLDGPAVPAGRQSRRPVRRRGRSPRCRRPWSVPAAPSSAARAVPHRVRQLPRLRQARAARVRWESATSVRAGAGVQRTAAAWLAARGAAESVSIPGGLSGPGWLGRAGRTAGRPSSAEWTRTAGPVRCGAQPRRRAEPEVAASVREAIWTCTHATAELRDRAP
jgi:hypothetical protein